MREIPYQKRVVDDIADYLRQVAKTNNLFKAWTAYWNEKGNLDMPKFLEKFPYHNTIKGVPNICVKVPTGGGKTFIACRAIKTITDFMPANKPKAVLWLVPSDSILEQTVKNLSNPNHPYRQEINKNFAGRVEVYTKDQLLFGQNFSPDTVSENLSIFVFSFASLRINSTKKDVRKVYQENGNLMKFAEYFNESDVLLADTPDTALIQVIRQLTPITIVDESHNAQSDLSIEMLMNVNPSFILELTATPKGNSNIISYVNAVDLKKENMVKLPIMVYNRKSREDVISDAVLYRNYLEKVAENAPRYIRPIVLFQAQPNNSDDSATFEKLKIKLIAKGIPEEQIAIKTSKINDLKGIDLMDRSCPIRYIITVNALKEGWDCPFAYILASVANKTSSVDVEQIVGRILREPYAEKYAEELLKTSFVFTSSNDFYATLANIVKGLNNAGFTEKDYRTPEQTLPIEPTKDTSIQEPISPVEENTSPESDEDFGDITSTPITPIDYGTSDNQGFTKEIEQARQQSKEYSQKAENSDSTGNYDFGSDVMNKEYKIKSEFADEIEQLRLPQFVVQADRMALFGISAKYELLTKDRLLEDFCLAEQDCRINFTFESTDIYHIDISDKDNLPKYRIASQLEQQLMKKTLAKMPEERQRKKIADDIIHQLNRKDNYSHNDISAYVQRAIARLSKDEIEQIANNIGSFAEQFNKKIEQLEIQHQEEVFYKMLATGEIECQPMFQFRKVISPNKTEDGIDGSLYQKEYGDIDGFEREALLKINATGNVLWWHRVNQHDRKDFCINGCVNHYPDFIFKTLKGNIVIVETKGDDRDNSDSAKKVKMGNALASYSNIKYFMVFDHKKMEGAYKLDEFLNMFKNM